jgi:hypothetical protein
MGEIRPPPSKPRRILRPDLGQPGLRKWYDDPRADAILGSVSDELQITQALEPFQRRIRISERSIISAVGERPLWRLNVPPTESWRIHWISFINGDNSDLTVTFAVDRIAPPPSQRFQFSAIRVTASSLRTLYPTRTQESSPNLDRWTYGDRAIELFPGDALHITTVGTVSNPAGASNRLDMRYELIPLPKNFSIGTPWIPSST